ncbi:MAG: hypothetical protein ACEQSR_02925 [Candidatus Methylacidiphilales bacterium]
MKKITLILFFITLSNLVLKAQRPNSFSYDPNVFITEFESFMRSGKTDVKDEADNFVANYNTGKFSLPQKQQMVKLCNEMLQKQMQPNTEFYFYMQTANVLVARNQMSKFDNWHKTLIGALKKNKDEFFRFLNVSKNVFAEDIMLKMGTSVWVIKAQDVDLKMEGQATFIFKNLDLVCYTPGDTLEVLKTNGRYFAGTNQFVGKGGKVDWSRVGFDTSRVYAKLNNYIINLADGLLTADSAMLTYKDKFKEPLMGKVIDKPLGSNQGAKSIYPQFESTTQTFTGLTYGKAKYKGGFGLRGALVVGKSSANQKAELYFYFKNKPVLRIASDEFFMRDNKITNDKVELTIFLDKDSIFHPQLRFTYLVNDDKISLYRDTKLGISAAPFVDYFHNLEIYVDELKWDINNPKIDLKNIAGDDPAKFQSINYFRDVIYERLQGMLDYNPLQRIKIYCEKFDIKSFNIESYAQYHKSDLSDIKLMMIDLNDRGFLNYNEQKKTVTIKPKLKEYVNAHMGRTDYDAISFKSIISAIPNAAISLINNDLIVQGVGRFKFSDSQNVEVTPKEQVLTIKRNRGIEFNGKLRAGMADFYGSNFSFDYTKFDVRLNNVDSLKFLYLDDTLGYLANVKSVIQNIYGTLEIDYPYNKSSRKNYPGYPKFTSEVGSKVFYDYPTTQQGNYDNDRFYFSVDPFKLDSLSDLNLYTLALGGTLESDGILPDMKQEIYLQPDKSLGFYIPNDTNYNYTLYRGKGSAKFALRLSNDGLIGDGDIFYLASKSTSKRFNLLLDSMNADCESFKNDRTALFPTVINSTNVYNHWIPYQDTMFILNKGEPIKIAYEKAELRGTLILTPQAMKAKGSMTIEDGELIADLYELRPVEILSENAIFRQRWPGDTTKIAFETKKVNAYVNLEKRYGEFTYLKPNEINNEFTYNLYEGSFEKLRWEMEPRTLEFTGKSEEQNPALASYLVSKRPSQERLTFKTASVKMSLGDYVLQASKVPYINVVDSKILPDSGKVYIGKDAEMNELLNAKINADTVTKFHKIEQVTVKINGRTDFRGQGNYIYLDKNKKPQRFYLNEIYPEDKKYLGGKSNIPDSINFNVGVKLAFRGNALLHSYNRNLEYNGFFKPLHNLYLPKTDWFKSAAIINPDTVYIDLLPPLTNLNRAVVDCGFVLTADSTHVTPAMFSRKRSNNDIDLLKVEGTFTYNDKFDEFRIGPYPKVFGQPARRGNFMAVSETKKAIYGEGKFNFNLDIPKFKLTTAGNSSFNLKDTTFTMHLAAVVDFEMPANALKLMVDSITDQSNSNSNDYFNKEILNIAIPEMVDDKTLKKMSDEASDELNGKLINYLFKAFFITDLKFKYDINTRSFISDGDFGVRSLDKYVIERRLQGRIQILKTRTKEEFVIYLQQNNGSWYYFKYSKGNLAILGSDPLFNEALKLGLDKVSGDGFTVRIASISDRNKLMRLMKAKQ